MTRSHVDASLRRKLLLAGSMAALLTGAGAPAFAQTNVDADEAKAEVEEVVVTRRFLATGASSGTKLDLRVLDTPVSVAAYTENFIDAIQTTNVADLYRYMTGVQRAGNTGYDLTMRGFRTGANDRNAIMTDGLPGLGVRFGSPPTIGTDHVELVKGPASLLYGQAQPGGFINIISKKPQATRAHEVQLRGNMNIGSPGRGAGADISIDTTGPLFGDRLLYRAIVAAGKTNGFRDFSYERSFYLAPSLTWHITDSTELTAQLEYRKVKTHYDNYLVAPGRNVRNIAPIETSYQEPEDYLLEKGLTWSLFLDHRFSDKLKFHIGYRGVDHDDYAEGYDNVAVLANLTQLQRRARRQFNVRTYHFADAYLTAEFGTGPIEHKLIAGLNAGRETSDFDRIQFFNGPATGAQSLTVSVINPRHGWPHVSAWPLVNPNTPANLNRRHTNSDAFGAYFSDLITFSEHWKAMVGLRYAKEGSDIEERKLTGVPDQKADNEAWLPMVGLMYQPTQNWTLYASYSTSFVPVPPTTQDINGLYTFDPTKAHSVEVGTKAELFDDRLYLTAAYFNIEKENVINSFSCSRGTCAEQVGVERSRGFELEFNARPTENWQITAGYSYVDAEVTESNIPAQIGARLTNTAKHNAQLWTRYDFEEGALKGLGLGLGVAYIGNRVGLLPTATSNDKLRLPGYTVVDVGVYYQLDKNVDLTLKVSNLFNEKYYESAGFVGDIQIVPGQPRWATLAIRARF